MRIMFAVPCYWPSQDGVTHITKYLAEGLAAKGHEVLVFTSTGRGGLQELPKTELHAGVQIERMRVYVRWPLKIQGRDAESNAKAYFQRVKQYRPDILIVVCAQSWTLDWIIPYLDQIACPKVFYSHGYSWLKEKYDIKEKLIAGNVVGAWGEYRAKRYYKRLYRILTKFELVLYLLENNNACVYAREHGLTNGKVLENAIEDAFLSEEMQHEAGKNKTVQFLCVANYNDNKNQRLVLEAFCKARMENARLVFAGFEENAYLQELRQLKEEWGSEKEVLFHVHLDRNEIYELYRKSDVFVCGSRLENAPIVHCEAAATGMAIISTPVGNVKEMDGILIAENYREMCLSMERLAGERNEMKWRGQQLRKYVIGKKCRVVDKVDWLEKNLEKL